MNSDVEARLKADEEHLAEYGEVSADETDWLIAEVRSQMQRVTNLEHAKQVQSDEWEEVNEAYITEHERAERAEAQLYAERYESGPSEAHLEQQILAEADSADLSTEEVVIRALRLGRKAAEASTESDRYWQQVHIRQAAEAQVATLLDEVTALREALMDWETKREAWLHREPFKFPDDAREVGWTSEEWIERKLAWMAVGDAYQSATGKLSMLARAALAGKQS